MRRITMVAALVVACCGASAQTIKLINSGQVLESAEVLSDSGKYDLALKELLTVPEQDTNHLEVQTEIVRAYINTEAFADALKLCDQLLSKPNSHTTDILRLKAIAVQKNGDYEGGIAIYKKALQQSPFSVVLLYGLASMHYGNKDYDRAKEAYFNVLKVFPYHAASHDALSRIAILQGRKTHAMLATGLYLAIQPTDNSQLTLINNFVSNQVTDEGTFTTKSPNGCERLDQIIKAKLALEKSFKTVVDVDAPVVRQYEMMFKQLSTITNMPDDLYLKFYLPIYKSLLEKQLVEPFVYHILTSANIDNVKKWNEKHEKQQQAYFTAVSEILEKSRSVIEVPASFGMGATASAEYTENHKLAGVGVIVDEKKHGPWKYFHPNYVVSAEGKYENGEERGAWTYYDDSGAVKNKEELNGDRSTGTLYYPNGTIRQKYPMKGTTADGELEFYYPCGALEEKTVYVDGKKQGRSISYYINGKVRVTGSYEADEPSGLWESFDEAGQLIYSRTFVKGKLEGPIKTYFSNGKLKSEGTYLNDLGNGSWTYYHATGVKEATGTMKNDQWVGKYTLYSGLGEIEEEQNYDDEGNFDGVMKEYYRGKLVAQKTYKKGGLYEVTSYDLKGNVTGKTGAKDGNYIAKIYYANGTLYSEGQMKKGKREGAWVMNFEGGQKMTEASYVQNLRQGKSTDYFKNGQIQMTSNYKDDKLDGYVQEYYINGKMKAEGWYTSGERQQKWVYYFPDGSISDEEYYLNGELTGVQNEYYDGKLTSRKEFDLGKFNKVEYFDESGKSISTTSEKDGHIHHKVANQNKELMSFDLYCGDMEGALAVKYPVGRHYYSLNYVAHKKAGYYSSTTPLGQPEVTGQYLGGTFEGTWKYYHPNGVIEREDPNVNGTTEGEIKFYAPTGKVTTVVPYQNDVRDGTASYYAEDGRIIYERSYMYNKIIGIRKLGADNKLTDWIPFQQNGTTTVLYPDGKKAYEETFKNGLLEGSRTQYYPGGILQSEVVYKNGEQEGKFTYYYPSGKVWYTIDYSLGYMHGKMTWLNEDGTTLLEETYYYGSRNGKAIYNNKGKKSEITFFGGISLR